MQRLLEFFLRRVTVEGSSMAPTYLRVKPHGVAALASGSNGDVVVVRDPRDAERWC